ncbi:ubiquitin protein ligase [Aureococcus anophagefferens]|nr:ubiquitin protein ligase [Aureococcus anophagefferens]
MSFVQRYGVDGALTFARASEPVDGLWKPSDDVALALEETRTFSKRVAAFRKGMDALRVSWEFRGEDGLDAGGLSREFFQLASAALFDANLGLFKVGSSENLTYQIADATADLVMADAARALHAAVGAGVGARALRPPDIGVADWRRSTVYKGAFAREREAHEVVAWFWETVETWDDDRLALLLHHTCFNRIDIPLFTSKAALAAAFDIALNPENVVGFSMD